MTRTERKRNDDINDIFSTFDEEFEEMRARMDKIMEQMLNGPIGFDEQPIVYSASLQIGPDGKPQVQESGNVRHLAPSEDERAPTSSREPLMDVIKEKDKVRVLVELPGVQKSEIDVRAVDVWLDISVDTEDKKFSKHIELPCPIRSDSVAASYRNGVLEVTMDREPPKRRKKKTIVQ
jgi:HSP20 family protein